MGGVFQHLVGRSLFEILPAYITATRSAICRATPTSWVTSSVAMPSRPLSSPISSRIWAWTVTSSAVVGSSAISSSGSQATARAMTTRWRIPPDSSWG